MRTRLHSIGSAMLGYGCGLLIRVLGAIILFLTVYAIDRTIHSDESP